MCGQRDYYVIICTHRVPDMFCDSQNITALEMSILRINTNVLANTGNSTLPASLHRQKASEEK